LENLNAFVQTNKLIQKGITEPNNELQALVERLKNIR
jgi:hypothetical protein